MEKTTFKDFLNQKDFVIYEVFNDGSIRQFNHAEFTTPDGNVAALKISLGFSTLTTRFVDVLLTHSVAYGKYSAVFIDREEAKAYAVKKISSVIKTASEYLSNVVNDNICISDVIDIQEGKNFILKA